MAIDQLYNHSIYQGTITLVSSEIEQDPLYNHSIYQGTITKRLPNKTKKMTPVPQPMQTTK